MPDSIDGFAKIIADGNNGGYANDWLLGDRKTGEIARFELGLKHTKLWRTSDGYFSGSNFPSDPDVIQDETTFSPDNLSQPLRTRGGSAGMNCSPRTRAKSIPTLAEAFLSDHYDTFTKKTGAEPAARFAATASSHGGEPGWDVKPYDPSGAVSSQSDRYSHGRSHDLYRAHRASLRHGF